MEIYGKIFTDSIIKVIREKIAEDRAISRAQLSRFVCGEMGWRSENGRLQEVSCRKALLELERRGILQLPENGAFYSFQEEKPTSVSYKSAQIEANLEELDDLEIEPIKTRYGKDSKVWFDLLNRYHYLGGGRLCGAQLRYIIKSKHHGYIGVLGFSSATWKLKQRDGYIGWTDAARWENIKYVISNDRFLIVPGVKVKNLASHLLAQVLKRLPDDWEQRYGYRPLLIESYVDPTRYRGTCYRASNWQYIGATSGRRDGVAKWIFIYPLYHDWQQRLCRVTPVKLNTDRVVSNPANWAEGEYGSVRLYDNRLKRRLYQIAQDFYDKPEANIPQACGSHSRIKAAYRFFQNKKVTMKVLLDAHTESTIERIKEHKVILAPQDTTILDYSTHPMTEGLGPTGTSEGNSIGLILHDTLAFSEDGVPLGVLDAQCWARDENDRAKRYRRKELPIEQKESMKWLHSYRRVCEVQRLCPDTLIVSVGDREADVYELFAEALKDPPGAGLLVRAERGRNRQLEDDSLWEYMSRLEKAGELQIHISRRGNRKARDARVEVRYSEVELKAPKSKASLPSLRLWAVYVKERQCNEVETPLEWMLLTTVPVNSFTQARARVEWYTRRWGIEVYHRTLKSGCRIKNRQLGGAESLEAALGIDMVVAWRIYHMTMLGRDIPNAPCTVFFKEEEWKALLCYVYKTPLVPDEPPTMREAMRMVANMGGFIGRKGDGEPGTQTLWRGLQHLDTATEMYIIFTKPRDGP